MAGKNSDPAISVKIAKKMAELTLPFFLGEDLA
jgi:hypothetical protein